MIDIFQRATSGKAPGKLARSALAGLALFAATTAAAEDSAPPTEAKPPVEVIFAGFARHADQGATVFVRLTGEVQVAPVLRGQQLTYRMGGAHLAAANNKNPLLTEHFGPPVSRISLVAVKDAVDLVIELSSASPSLDPAAFRLVTRDGLATLQVDLPAPTGS
jgi:hypothetical protein